MLPPKFSSKVPRTLTPPQGEPNGSSEMGQQVPRTRWFYGVPESEFRLGF